MTSRPSIWSKAAATARSNPSRLTQARPDTVSPSVRIKLGSVVEIDGIYIEITSIAFHDGLVAAVGKVVKS